MAKKEPEAPPAEPSTPPPAAPAPVDLGVAAENERLLAQVQALRDELAHARAAAENESRSFREAWDAREQEIAAAMASAPPAPPAPRKKVAANLLRCHTRSGAKLTLQAGQEIPDTVDLASLPTDAIQEV